MNRNQGALTFLILAILAILAGFWLLAKLKPEPVSTPVPQEQARQSVVNVDSIKSQIESQYRDSLQAQIKASDERYSRLLAKLPKSRDKAVASVKQYQNTPTLANCDTAIADLQNHIGQVETGLAVADSIMKGQAAVIGSYAGTLQRKDSVLNTLSAGWEQANKALATEKQKDWGLGVQIGGTLFNGKPTPYIGAGLNYNVCRFRLKLPTSKK